MNKKMSKMKNLNKSYQTSFEGLGGKDDAEEVDQEALTETDQEATDAEEVDQEALTETDQEATDAEEVDQEALTETDQEATDAEEVDQELKPRQTKSYRC